LLSERLKPVAMHLVTFVEIILILLTLLPATRSGIELVTETAQEAAATMAAFALSLAVLALSLAVLALLALLPFISVLPAVTESVLQGIHSCCSLVGDGDIEGRQG
jgi:hypothetical protein